MSITPKAKRPPKTLNEKRVVKKVAEGKSMTQAVREVYNVTTTSSATSIAHELNKKLDIKGLIEQREGLSDDALLEDLEEGLNAYKRSTSLTEPDSLDPDFAVRHKWWTSAMQLKGHLAKAEDGGQTINFLQFIQNQKNDYGKG